MVNNSGVFMFDIGLSETKCLQGLLQGVWKRKEKQMTRPALPYDYTCFADGTIHLNKNY